jgi:hypothetical protein
MSESDAYRQIAFPQLDTSHIASLSTIGAAASP